jgi:TPR repeat protein
VFKLSLAYCYAPSVCVGILYDIGTAYLTGGSPPPQLCSGCSATPRPVHQDEHQAFLWIRWAAELGYNRVQFQVAKMYFSGTGVANDESQGQLWFRKAVEKTTLEERFWNGESCYFGKNMPRADRLFDTPQCSEQDYKSAFMWFTTAAELGHAKAMYYLGWMYESGQGVPQDYNIAFDWYTKSAQAGDADGECSLGTMYYEGCGVTQDYEKAFEWWSKAADKDNALAQVHLGVMYEHGEGVAKDYKKAEEWYTKAARQGEPHALPALEKMFAKSASTKSASTKTGTTSNRDNGGLFWQLAINKNTGEAFGFRMRQTKAEVTDALLKVGFHSLKCVPMPYDVENCETSSYTEVNPSQQAAYYSLQSHQNYNLQFHHGRLTHVEYNFHPEEFQIIAFWMLKNYGSSPPQLVYGSASEPQYYWGIPNAEIILSKFTAMGWSTVNIKDDSPLTSSY